VTAEELAQLAADSTLGERLWERCVRNVVLMGLASDAGTEKVVAEGMYEAEDDGQAMADAALLDLPEHEQRKIAAWAYLRTHARCLAAAGELLDAADALGLNADDVDPGQVALLAAGRACGRAALIPPAKAPLGA
jgi:hypothetical protein